MEAFEQFSKEKMQAEMEKFAFDNGISYEMIMELFTTYVFSATISDEGIRQKLSPYKLGLLKLTKLTKDIHTFIENTLAKYKAEGN